MTEAIAAPKHSLTEAEAIHLAVAMQAKQDYANALPHLKRAVELYAESAQLHFLLALVYADLNLRAEAIGCLQEAVALKPDFQLANMLLGLFLHLQGDAAQAQQAWHFVSGLPAEHAFRYFQQGFQQLASQQLEQARDSFINGLAVTGSLDEINREIKALCQRIEAQLDQGPQTSGGEHHLLSRYGKQ